jgi:hypothetical protein
MEIMVESSHSSNLNENGVDIPASILLDTPSLSYAYSDSSTTSTSVTNQYDDDNNIDAINRDDGSTDSSYSSHANRRNPKEKTSISNLRLSALSLNICALSAMHSTALKPSNEMISSSFTSAVSVTPSCSTVGVESLSSTSSYIRSRSRAPPTTFATSPTVRAIVIPSKTDAVTYVAATIESFPKSVSSFSSYDDDMFYNSFKTSCYDKFKFVITEFGVITHIKTKPIREQVTRQSSSNMVYSNNNNNGGGGSRLAGLVRVCASALGIGNFDMTTSNNDAYSSINRVASRISSIMLDPQKAIGQPIFRYVHNDDLPVLCRTLSRAHERVARCAIRWSSDMDKKSINTATINPSHRSFKGNTTNTSKHRSSTRLSNTTSLKWRWVWITIRQYDDFMICTLRRPIDEDYDDADDDNEYDNDGDTSNFWTIQNSRRSTFIGLGEYLLSFLLPSNDDDGDDDNNNYENENEDNHNSNITDDEDNQDELFHSDDIVKADQLNNQNEKIRSSNEEIQTICQHATVTISLSIKEVDEEHGRAVNKQYEIIE